MAQTARPTSDITVDSWTTSPLWSKTNDQSDSTFMVGPSGATTQCEVALASLTDPASSASHIMTVRAKVASGSSGGEKLTWYLYQGATLKATSVATTISRTTITDYSYTLTAGEADSITNYADLRIRVAQTTIGSGETINVYEVSLSVPDAPNPVVVTPDTASLTTSTFAPTIYLHKIATIGVLSLVTATFAPTVLTPRLVTPDVAALSLSTFAPTVGVGVTVTPDTASLALTTFAPTIPGTSTRLRIYISAT